MKKLLLIAFLISAMSSLWAADYVSVSGWQNCVKSIDQKIYKYFCLPPSKPAGCSDTSWNTLTKGQMLPLCPLCPKK